MSDSRTPEQEAPTPATRFVCGGTPTPEAQRELDDFAEWLRVEKYPRPEFRAWRRARFAAATPIPETPHVG
jgi:hypothetical protein